MGTVLLPPPALITTVLTNLWSILEPLNTTPLSSFSGTTMVSPGALIWRCSGWQKQAIMSSAADRGVISLMTKRLAPLRVAPPEIRRLVSYGPMALSTKFLHPQSPSTLDIGKQQPRNFLCGHRPSRAAAAEDQRRIEIMMT